MVRVFVLSVSLLLLVGAAIAEVYNGDLLLRDGLWYKPRSIEPFSGLNREWRANGQLSEAANGR